MSDVPHACLGEDKCLRVGRGSLDTNFRAGQLDLRLSTCWIVNESASDHVKC